MKFNDIVGQKEIVKSLHKILETNRVGHAYIFSGPVGSGKATIAGLFADWLMCADENADFYNKPCGKCHSCLMMKDGSHPDFKIITEGQGSSILIETIRQLQQSVNVRPLYARKKVYIIQNGEKMTEEAQNCLLKTFEEPYDYVTIIITTSNYEALLNTIRSRAVRYELKPNTQKEIEQVLYKRNDNYSSEKIRLSCLYSEGIIGKAISIIESGDFADLRQKAVDIATRLLSCDMLERLEYFAFFEENANRLDDVLNLITLWYRDLYFAACGAKDEVLINFDKEDIIVRKATEIRPERLYRIIRNIEHVREAINGNVNFQLAIEYMLIMIGEEVV